MYIFICVNGTLVLTIPFHFLFQHLIDVAACVVLACPLVKNFCQRLSTIFELEQKLAKFQPPPSSIPKTVAEDPPIEDDSVFDSSTTVSVKTEPGISGIKTELHSKQAPRWAWPQLKPGRSPACRHRQKTASIQHLMTGKSPSYNYVCVQRRIQE